MTRAALRLHDCMGAECACQTTAARDSFIAAAVGGSTKAATAGARLAVSPLSADFSRNGKPTPPSGRRILLKGGTIISMDRAVGDFAKGDLLIEGSKIAAIAPDIEADADIIDAAEMIVIPGFCDPHIHAWQGNLPRIIPNHVSTAEDEIGGTTESAASTRSYRAVFHQTFGPAYRPEDTYIGTLMSLLAALNGGITTVCDNAHNSRSPAHSDASIQAMRDAGVRGVHAYGRPRMGKFDTDFRDVYRLKQQYFSSDDQLTSLRLFMLGRDPMEELQRQIRIRRDLDLWMTFDSGIGTKPVVELYADGSFDGRETVNHGTFVSREKMEAFAAHGAMVNVCPRIETQFRFGEIPYQAWVDVGLKPAISNDDPGTYAIDMFHEMQTLYSFRRSQSFSAAMRRDPAAPKLATVREMLEAATLRGAQNCALGHKVGSLTPGKDADIVMIDTANIHLYPKANALCTVVEGAGVGFVDTVFVAGRLMKWQGKLVGVDFEAIRRLADQSREFLFKATNWPLDAIDFTD